MVACPTPIEQNLDFIWWAQGSSQARKMMTFLLCPASLAARTFDPTMAKKTELNVAVEKEGYHRKVLVS